MNNYAIIVAGGSGIRMKSDIPKQFIEICGKPILMHTLENFKAYDPEMEIVLVLPQQQKDFWIELCHKHHFNLTYTLVSGGKTRFHSVQNGLSATHGNGLVFIHDGVRPLVSHATIRQCAQQASVCGNAIPVIPVHESVRQTSENGSQMIDRSRLSLVQTPQVFDTNIIKQAYEQPYDEQFTDDASVLERMGHTICMVPGNRENIKVTEPFDLIVAEALLRNKPL
jgi:2-C-methyl-D-erythritol 4-phosphate cytidylyltransferase